MSAQTHVWQPDSGFCTRCGIGVAQAHRDSRLAVCNHNVVGIGLRVVSGNWRQFNAWLPTDDGGAA